MSLISLVYLYIWNILILLETILGLMFKPHCLEYFISMRLNSLHFIFRAKCFYIFLNTLWPSTNLMVLWPNKFDCWKTEVYLLFNKLAREEMGSWKGRLVSEFSLEDVEYRVNHLFITNAIENVAILLNIFCDMLGIN